MRTFKIIIIAIVTMYVGVEAIGNVMEDVTYHNQSDIRARMDADRDAYEARYNK